MYKYIHTCIYMHISCPHTYTHAHAYTHAYKMYIWTHEKHIWNDGAAATARAVQLDTKKLCPFPCPHHDSAPSRPHPLICTGAEPIHPVHCPRQLRAWPWPPETRSFFCHFGGVSLDFLVCLSFSLFLSLCASLSSFFLSLSLYPFSTGQWCGIHVSKWVMGHAIQMVLKFDCDRYDCTTIYQYICTLFICTHIWRLYDRSFWID